MRMLRRTDRHSEQGYLGWEVGQKDGNWAAGRQRMEGNFPQHLFKEFGFFFFFNHVNAFPTQKNKYTDFCLNGIIALKEYILTLHGVKHMLLCFPHI